MGIISGDIQPGGVYGVLNGSIIYDGHSYVAGPVLFKGVLGVTTYTGTGTVFEVTQIRGVSMELVINNNNSIFSSETTNIRAFSVELSLNEAEKIVQETTKISGMGIELIDYPFYAFTIIESRL